MPEMRDKRERPVKTQETQRRKTRSHPNANAKAGEGQGQETPRPPSGRRFPEVLAQWAAEGVVCSPRKQQQHHTTHPCSQTTNKHNWVWERAATANKQTNKQTENLRARVLCRGGGTPLRRTLPPQAGDGGGGRGKPLRPHRGPGTTCIRAPAEKREKHKGPTGEARQ